MSRNFILTDVRPLDSGPSHRSMSRFNIFNHKIKRSNRTGLRLAWGPKENQVGATTQFEDCQVFSIKDRTESQRPVEVGCEADIGDVKRDMANRNRRWQLFFGLNLKRRSFLFWHH